MKNLDGLHCTAAKCSNFQGLNLADIPATNVESILPLWKILPDIKKLSCITIEVCILKPVSLDAWYQQQLINAIQKHTQAMEVDQTLNL